MNRGRRIRARVEVGVDREDLETNLAWVSNQFLEGITEQVLDLYDPQTDGAFHIEITITPIAKEKL